MTSRRACAQLPFRCTHTHPDQHPIWSRTNDEYISFFAISTSTSSSAASVVCISAAAVTRLMCLPFNTSVQSANASQMPGSDVTNIESDHIHSFGPMPSAYYPSSRSVTTHRSFWNVYLMICVLTNVYILDVGTVDQMTVSTESPQKKKQISAHQR